MGKKICVYRGLLGKHVGQGTLERSRHIWKDNIKINLQEV
jgi:hypothetical protein